jgi:hypothetical protein
MPRFAPQWWLEGRVAIQVEVMVNKKYEVLGQLVGDDLEHALSRIEDVFGAAIRQRCSDKQPKLRVSRYPEDTGLPTYTKELARPVDDDTFDTFIA